MKPEDHIDRNRQQTTRNKLTLSAGEEGASLRAYHIGKIKIKFADFNADMVGLDAEARVLTTRFNLVEALAIGGLQWDATEQDHHHQIESPHLF